MNIAFCVNRLALIGLGPTLSSMVRNSSNTSSMKLWIMCADLNVGDKENISNLLDEEGFKGVVQFIDFNPLIEFSNFRSLHGDWTTYGRLLLPDLVQEKTILYLDADLIIELDLISFEGVLNIDQPLGAVHSGQLETAYEHQFYTNKLQLSPKAASFNAGIIVLNLELWRKNNIKEACINIASQFPDELLSCDQTLLNAIFADKFVKLPNNFNCAWYADLPRPKAADKMILHFVGSPKPWDPFASLIHNGFNTWYQYLTPEWKESYNQINSNSLKRAWQIRRSYVKRVVNKLTNR